VVSEEGGSPVAVEAVISVFYLSTQSEACMSDVVSQVISPGPSSILSSSLIEQIDPQARVLNYCFQ